MDERVEWTEIDCTAIENQMALIDAALWEIAREGSSLKADDGEAADA